MDATKTTAAQSQITTSTKRYSLTVAPMAHRDGWDVFGELVKIKTVSSGMRVDGGELVVLEITAPASAFADVDNAFEDDDSVIAFSVR